MSHCCDSQKLARPSRKLVFATLVVVLVYFGSFLPFKHLASLNQAFNDYFAMFWWASLLGLFLGGLLGYFVPNEWVTRFLGQHPRSILLASVLGIFFSGCSHGILAIAIQLHKKGASTPAVIAFLLASPWASITISILLFSFFGVPAIWFLFFAWLIAVVSGLVFLLINRFGWLEKRATLAGDQFPKKIPKKNFTQISRGVFDEMIKLANMVLWWLWIGLMISVLIRAYVPTVWFGQFVGPNVFGLLMTLVFATVIEVCSEGSSPIAFEIYDQTQALGNSFAFLMAGVATDYTEIGLIWQNIGKKTALWLPLITLPQIILVAWLLNYWFA